MSSKLIIVLLIIFHYASSGNSYEQYIKVYKLDTDSSRKVIGNTFVNNSSSQNYQIISVRDLLSGENTTKNNELFQVDETSGMLSMSSIFKNSFELTIKMQIVKSGVMQKVLIRVDIDEITDIKIQNSGSIQFYGITAQSFIVQNNRTNLIDKLKSTIVQILKVYHMNRYNSIDTNVIVDIFAINQNPKNASLLDVRFKVTSENTKNFENVVHYMMMQDKNIIEKELGVQITAININECLNEEYPCKSSCYNKLSISNDTKTIEANNLSFLGLNITTNAVCEFQNDLSYFNREKNDNQNIELRAKFSNYYPPIPPNVAFSISFNVILTSLTGVLLYFGPLYSHFSTEKDFLLLELNNGLPTLVIEFGSGELVIPSKCILTPSTANSVNIIIHENIIEINIGNGNSSNCRTSTINNGSHKVLNINTPTRIGWPNIETFNIRLNKTYNALNYSLNGYVQNFKLTNFFVNNHNHEVEQNNAVETKSHAEPQPCQNTILYIIIGMLVVAVVFLILLLLKMKLVRSSFIVTDKQKLFSNLELKDTIADKLVEPIDSYESSTHERNGESGLYSEIQNDVTEYNGGYVDVEDIKRDKVVPKNIADLYSVVNKNQR